MKVQETKGSNLPGAWIVNPKDKGRKPIKSDNVYLDDNEEFQIELFNPLKLNVLADIRLNGQSISKTGLIVKPGQRFYLDCFVDDKKKFIFQTYQVDDTQESHEAVENNGLMEVFFYKEEVVTLKNWPDRLRQTVIHEYYPIYVDRYPYWYQRPTIMYGNSTGTITTNGMCNTTCNTASSSNLYNNNSTFTITGGLSSYSDGSNLINCSSNTLDSNFTLNSFETGRVEKGNISNQQFVEVDMDFEKNYIHSIILKLLPTSIKPIDLVSDNFKAHQKIKIGHDAADLIVKLKDLYDSGILDKSEFEEKKKELLARI